MTSLQFRRAVATTRLGPRTTAAARAVLVRGLSNAAAGREVGLTRESVRVAVGRVRRAHNEVCGCPSGWRMVTVCLPLDRAKEVEAMSAALPRPK